MITSDYCRGVLGRLIWNCMENESEKKLEAEGTIMEVVTKVQE